MQGFMGRLGFQRTLHMRLFSTKRRFFEKATVEENGGKYYIQLDKKTIKTPLKHVLYVPTKQLASIVATEWQSQKHIICADKMHLTALCNTCIDNPKQQTRQEIIEDILVFLHADTLCTRVPIEENEMVANLQKETWDPLLDWFNKRFDLQMLVSDDIIGVEQTNDTIQKIHHFLSNANIWQLTGLLFAIESIKSFLVPMAVLDHKISVEEAMHLSRLETETQIEKWGNVEWYHDVDYANQKGKLTAGILFYQLCSELHSDS